MNGDTAKPSPLRVAVVGALLCAAAAGALPNDPEQPIHWRADHAEGDMTGRTVLTGGVRMDQGSLLVEADRMVIEYEAEQVVRITAEGDLAHYEQRPRADADLVKADAEKIVYHTAEERVELIGRAWLTHGAQRVPGRDHPLRRTRRDDRRRGRRGGQRGDDLAAGAGCGA